MNDPASDAYQSLHTFAAFPPLPAVGPSPTITAPKEPTMPIFLRSLLVLVMTAVMCGAAEKQVHHMVMFTWKADTTAEQAAAIEKALTGLKEKVPGIVSLTYGKQTSAEDAAKKHGFQYGLSVIFTNAAARDGYVTNPDHQAAVKVLLPYLEDVAVLDYDL